MGKSSKDAYQDYLNTDKWKTIRAQRLAMDNGECAICDSKAEIVHHRRYPKKWGTETIKDLSALCKSCHEKFHEKVNGIECESGVIIPADGDKCGHIYNELTDESASVEQFQNMWNLSNALIDLAHSDHVDFMKIEINTLFGIVNGLCERVNKMERNNA